MDKKQEHKGYWWFPSNPDQNLAGTLTYIPYEHISLALIGPIGTPAELIESFQNRSEPIIHGVTSDAKKSHWQTATAQYKLTLVANSLLYISDVNMQLSENILKH